MKQYLDLLQNILDNGVPQSNRTSIDALTLPGAMLKFDLRDGFPAVTTKKLFFDAVKGELVGFLQGSDNVLDFQALGCNVWNQNAHAPNWVESPACEHPGHLGRIYGTQWRDWAGYSGGEGDSGDQFSRYSIDQIAVALYALRNTPHSRRIIVNAWNPAELEQACLPPCHVLFQLLPHVDSKVLHMTMYQRSCDMFLGVPFNIASYALLLELFAAWSGYTAGTLTMFLADAHIYVNHIDQVREQLSREILPLPKLLLDFDRPLVRALRMTEHLSLEELLQDLTPGDIRLVDYQHHPAIKAPMAV